eukprot:s4835_g2.t1
MDPGLLMMWQMLHMQHQAALGLQAMATPPRPPHDVANAAHAAPGCFGLASNGNTSSSGAPHFGPSQAVEAKKAIQQFLKEIQEVSRASANTRRDPQLLVRFVQPVESVEVLRTKIAKFHAAAGPPVEVAPADGSQPWKKPSGSAWYAERKGDSRKCVFRVNVPGEDTASGKGKPKSMSFQVLVGGRELSVTAFKSLMTKFGGNLIMMFGPQKSIQVNQTCAAGLDLTKFWGK